jgi:hypothetical protein
MESGNFSLERQRNTMSPLVNDGQAVRILWIDSSKKAAFLPGSITRKGDALWQR